MTREELIEKIEKEEIWLLYVLIDQPDMASSYSVDIAFDSVKHHVKDYIRSYEADKQCMQKQIDKLQDYIDSQPCGDAISRQAVLYLVADYDLSMGQVVKAIHALPSVTPQQRIGRWISVSERLPEKNMLCLVSVGKLYLTQTAIYSDLMGTIDQRIFYQGDYGHETFVDITEYVNAWMPLPKPYKAEREDGNE